MGQAKKQNISLEAQEHRYMKVQTVKTYKKDKQSSSHAKYVSIHKKKFCE